MILKILVLSLTLASMNAVATCHKSQSDLDLFLETKGYNKLCYKQLATKHAVIDVTVNGRKAYFVLDSGASVTVVHRDSIPNFRLLPTEKVDYSNATGVGGSVDAQTYSVESFKVKHLNVEHPSIFGMDLSHVVNALNGYSKQPIEGVIGQDILSKHQAIIDIASNTIYLKP